MILCVPSLRLTDGLGAHRVTGSRRACSASVSWCAMRMGRHALFSAKKSRRRSVPPPGPIPSLPRISWRPTPPGAQFFELKTVQIMDGGPSPRCVAKPCITAGDECYNCEWSTELTVPQAYEEYVKAWFACKLLAKELALGDPDGFVFNMSVGYDLEGIKSPKIDAYLEGMKDASGSRRVADMRMEWALDNTDRFEQVDAAYIRAVSPRVSCSITESTLHGCPPDEIERIATYLITERGSIPISKCNPTLLGYTFARKRLDSLGFDYVTFDDHHFAEDLQWTDAVPMFRRLMGLCAERKLEVWRQAYQHVPRGCSGR